MDCVALYYRHFLCLHVQCRHRARAAIAVARSAADRACALPPGGLITVPVQLAMMGPAHRNGELIADLASQGPRLGKAQMVGVGRSSTAYQARLSGYVLAMILVAQPDGLGRHTAAGRAGSSAGAVGWPAASGRWGDLPFTGSDRVEPDRFSRLRIIQRREPDLETRFDQLRVVGRQGVLRWQVLMRPGGGFIARLQALQFGEQSIPLQCGLVGSQDGTAVVAGRPRRRPLSAWRSARVPV